jgi:hypothetical protein
MSELDNIKIALDNIIKKRLVVSSLRCTVSSIDKSNYSIDASPDNGDADMLGVSLIAGNDGAERSIILYPKQGSWVTVTIIDNNKHRAFVSEFSEIDSIEIKGNQELIIDMLKDITIKTDGKLSGVITGDISFSSKGKFEFKNDTTNLKAILNTLVDNILAITVICSPPTYTNTKLENAAAITKLKETIAALFT